MWWQLGIGVVLAYLLWEVLAVLKTLLSNQAILMRALAGRPELNSERAAGILSDQAPPTGRTVLDNLVAEVYCLNERLRSIDARTAYLQSYTWECLDRREWDEMRPGAPPAELGWLASPVRNRDLQHTQLWPRQWDINMRMSRDAADPPRARTQGAAD